MSTGARLRGAALGGGLAIAAGAACGGEMRSAEGAGVPEDSLLSRAPAGPELVFEVDVRRLRESEVLGDAMPAAGGGAPPSEAISGAPRLADLALADEALVAIYHWDRDGARALALARGGAANEIEGAEILAGGIAALGPPDLVDVAAEAARGEAEAAAEDERLAELRSASTPPGAPGAALRAFGDLDWDARAALAADLGLPDAPVAISAWGDVVDDLAVIALFGAEGVKEAHELAEAARAYLDALARAREIARHGLGPPLRAADVEAEGATVKLTLVISPARLERAAEALAERVDAGQGGPP